SDPGGQVGSQSPSIADMTSLDFQIDARLLYDNRTLTAGYDPSLHASQYNIFYTVQNLNTASAGYGDFLWFGTALYDDREDVTGRHVLIDEFTQKLIYSIGIEPFTSEHIADGNWISVSGDLLPHMKAALDTAWSQGILLDSQDYADYRIGGVNLGWEMPGLNDASLQIRNYNVVANVAGQFDATTRGLWHMDTIDTYNDGTEDLPYVADDNSTIRDGHPLLLGSRPLLPSTTDPTLTPGAPGMGNALLFDGVDDRANSFNVWGDPVDHISVDFLMRPDGLPDLHGDNFMGTVSVLPLQIFLQDDGSGMGNLVAMAFNEYGNPLYGFSQGGLELGQWHDVHVEVTNTGGAGFGVLSVTVDDVTNSFNMAALLNTDWASMAVIGRDVNAYSRWFDGALDEIRIATDPYVSPLIPGDANEDGSVDVSDLGILATNYDAGSGFGWGDGDFTGDGLVDVSDLGILATNYGMGTAAQAVPEPATLSLLLLGGVLVCGMPRLRNQFRRNK
ncbi:MAG: hypothetical protein U9N87_08155, partial [Planctomycetota bacterium]|nr:hypothetical protein [Planctomycetota bacterium]